MQSIIDTQDCDKLKLLLANAIEILSIKSTTLDMTTRTERRKMGTARQGYANLILPIALNNINELPRDKDPNQLSTLMDALKNIAVVRGLAQKLLEMADDTMMAMGIDAVADTDQLAAAMQLARRDNDGLDQEMGEVDKYNSRFGKQMEEEDQEPQTPDAGTTTPTS